MGRFFQKGIEVVNAFGYPIQYAYLPAGAPCLVIDTQVPWIV